MEKFKIIFCIWCCMILFVPEGFSQHYDVGLGVGGMNYTGDVNRRYNITHTRPGGLVFGRYNFNDVVSARLSFTAGNVFGSDSVPFDALSSERNYEFSVLLLEGAGTIEYHFLDYKEDTRYLRWSPYFFAGVGISWINGHNDPNGDYSNLQPVIPFGIGFKYVINPLWTLGFEAGARKTFYDYLDNISEGVVSDKNYQYGNKYTDDWYYFMGFTISYTFYSVPCPYKFDY